MGNFILKICSSYRPRGANVHSVECSAPCFHTGMLLAVPNGISVGSSVFTRFTGVTNTQTRTETTERQTCVATGRLHTMHLACDAT